MTEYDFGVFSVFLAGTIFGVAMRVLYETYRSKHD